MSRRWRRTTKRERGRSGPDMEKLSDIRDQTLRALKVSSICDEYSGAFVSAPLVHTVDEAHSTPIETSKLS